MTKVGEVVTAFLFQEGKVLIVRRSRAVGTYPGRWSAISGYLEHAPLEQALIEIEEETGLRAIDVQLLAQGAPIDVEDASLQRRWRVYPFAFALIAAKPIRLDWENVEYRWVQPQELQGLGGVPGLAEALSRVWPPKGLGEVSALDSG